jgi:hypothetical protein
MAPLSFQVSAIVKMIFSSDFSILFQPFEVTRTSSLRNQLIPSAKSAERRPCPKQQVNSCPQPSAGVTGIAGIAKRRSRDTSQVQWFAKSCHVRFWFMAVRLDLEFPNQWRHCHRHRGCCKIFSRCTTKIFSDPLEEELNQRKV